MLWEEASAALILIAQRPPVQNGQLEKALLGPRLVLQVLQISCTPQGKTNAHLHSAKATGYREKGMSAQPAFI